MMIPRRRRSELVKPSRRSVLLSASCAATSLTLGCGRSTDQQTSAKTSRSSNRKIALIGAGFRGLQLLEQLIPMAGVDVVAVCDVDTERLSKAKRAISSPDVTTYSDYRRILARQDVSCVVIATPDHWHAKMTIDSVAAGKDVYCEKPMSLTIREGQQVCEKVRGSNCIVQIGTQQRSEFDQRFVHAVGVCQQGLLGKIKKITCALGGERPEAKPFIHKTPPPNLDWDSWLGPSPKVPYVPERCHYNFRWWYEYGGGKVTDWGAHHCDIAQWMMDLENGGPVRVSGEAEFDDVPDSYNTPRRFRLNCNYENGAEVELVHRVPDKFRTGILVEGETASMFVSRMHLVLAPALLDKFDAQGWLRKTGRSTPQTHFENFFQCVDSRQSPVSNVFTQHRSATTCHLANISLRLGREIQWDPIAEQFVDDAEAMGFISRTAREGYEIG